MNRDQELEIDAMENVVNFPFGGIDRISPKNPSVDVSDPLEELLNEFADWEIDDEEWEPTVTISETEISAFFPTIENESDDELELLTKQVALLEDVTKRMKFYLDEIELFTPYIKR